MSFKKSHVGTKDTKFLANFRILIAKKIAGAHQSLTGYA